MKESKAVYVRKRDFNAELNREYQFYATKIVRDVEYLPEPARYDQKTQEVGCQYDSKRDNLICTCRYLAPPRRRQEIKYFGSPKEIYAYQRSRSFTDIGVGSVKALQRKKVKRIYLPETIERGVGSSNLSAYFLQRTKQNRASSYYENKRTSSKCVGGILEYNIGCVINEKLSPIMQTISGSTSYKESIFNKTIEIGSSSVVKSLTNTTTQVENSNKREINEIKFEVRVKESREEIVQPIIIIQEDPIEMKTIIVDSHKASKTKAKRTEKGSSSDSLLQHVHNLESPSAERNSHMSLEAEDLMENKLEMEYRNIFAAKSKSTDSKHSQHTSDLKSTSTLKRRFEALRRGLAKKDDSKKNAVVVNKVSSQVSARSRKDVSINSDPPSLEGRSFSNTKPYSPFATRYSRDKAMYHPRSSQYRRFVTGDKNERGSAEWSSKVADDDNESQGVKGMFKLWGKKFNLEEDHYKRRCTPKPSYNSTRKGPTKKSAVPKVQVNPTSKPEIDEKKEGRKFLFFKNKKKSKEKPFKAKKGVTAGRCEVRDGLVIKILGGNVFDPEDNEKEPEIKSTDYEEIVRKAWLKKFLTPSIDSRNSVKVRWNNKTYAPSSSTVFELMDNIYKDTSIVFRSKSQVTVHSSYKSYTRQHVNFMQQNIEAWMIPKTIKDIPTLQLPAKQIKQQLTCKSDEDRKDNMEVRISNQKWFIDKSKAFSHKIEVVLHSKNFCKFKKEESSEYLRIDIPKGFFLDSSNDEINKHITNQSSDEEVFKIVEYETDSDLKKDKATRNLNIGDHKKLNKIKVTVSVKESKKCVEGVVETTIMKPTRRDVVVQGSNVYIPKNCDVVGVGIITHRELSQVRKPILKIQDDFSDDESEHNLLKSHTKKCEFAESYLQEYYRHWTPLGIDLYPWCASDSQLKCSSEHSRSSYHNQGDGTKSCPNIFEDFQTSAIVSSCGASSCSQCYKLQDNASDKNTKYKKKKKKTDGKKCDPDKRVVPKDSIEVFKRRKIYATSMKSRWCCSNPDFDQPSAVQSCESGVNIDQITPQTECPKLIKPCCKSVEPKNRKRQCKRHVTLPDCDTMNNMLAKQLSTKVPESILAFKGSGCDICKKKGSTCPKHTKVNPRPTCEIPRAPCRDSCEQVKKPPCSASKQSCEKPPPCPSPCPSSDSRSLPCCPIIEPCQIPALCEPKAPSCPHLPPCPPKTPPCPISPPPCRSPPNCPPSPPFPPKKKPPCPPSPPCPPKKKPPCPPSPPCPPKKKPPCPTSPPCPPKKKSPCPPSPPCPLKKKPPCPPSPPCPPKKKPPCPPSPPCPPKKKPPSCPPTPRTPPSPPCPPKKSPCPPKSPPSCPPTPPPTCVPPPCCRKPPPCPPSPPSCPPSPPPCTPSPPRYCVQPPRCPPSPPTCVKPARCPSHPSCHDIHIMACPPKPALPPCPHIPPCTPRFRPPSPRSAPSPPYPPPPCSPPPCPPPSCPPPPCLPLPKPKPCFCPPLPPPSCPRKPPPCLHSPPCPPSPPFPPPCRPPQRSPPCPSPTSPCPHTPPCTLPPCSKSSKKCPRAPPSCPTSPPLCCTDPNRCPALPPPCKKSSSCIKKLFKKKPPQVCPASSPCKPTSCKQSFCRSLACQQSMTSISYKALHPDAPYYYSPIHPCPPEEPEKPKSIKCSTPPCSTNDDFPWPTKNHMSNQSSRTSLCQNYQESNVQYKRDCPMMPRMSCETVPSLKTLKMIDCKTSCPNYPGSPRLPCLNKIRGMQCPAPPRHPSPPAAEPIKVSTPVPGKSKSKISGLFLKMMPSTKKSTCSKDCLAWESRKQNDGCISINSQEKITIRLKKETPSTEEIREGLNIKVQDEDGMTLFERKDYRLQHAGCSIDRRASLLGEMYKASEVHRVTTNDPAQAIGTDKDKRKEIKEVSSDASIANLIEIQFKLKVTQGEKTTEIDIANDGEKENGENIESNEPKNKSTQEVFVVKNEGERPAEHSDQNNDINIRIVIKNFQSKLGKNKSVNLKHEHYNDFSKKISAKFHTVSTGYSDIFHDDKVFSVHRATVDLTSSVDNTKTYHTSMHSNRSMHSKKSMLTKKSVNSNRSVEIMNQPANEIGRAILVDSSEVSVCRCITTEEEKSEDNEPKSYPSQKYSNTKEIHETAEETDTQLTDHKYEYNEDTDTDKPMNYDTEETDTDRQVDPPKYDTETDTEKRPNKKYDTFMSTTDTDEPDTLPEIKKSLSLDVNIKPQTKEEKIEMLKDVMERVHGTKYKNKTRMRKLRDMLKVILTSDSSDHEDNKVPASDLAKDVTYASLKPNYFRDTDSMNNYYKVESKTVLSETAINRQVVYPTVENNSDCSNSVRSVDVLSSENESKREGGCMCSAVAARLKLASRLGCEGGGCCCAAKQVFKKNEETTCDLKRESDYTQIDSKTAEFVDLQTQNSRCLTSKMNSTNLSVHSSIRPCIGGSFNFEEGIQEDSGVLNVDSRQLSLGKTISPEKCHIRECEMRKRNRDAILSISDEEKVILLSGPTTRKNEKKNLTGMHASDILQSYDAKKAVLEIYTEKTISDDGEHLVAKLPKFVYDREQEIQANYEAMATNTYRTVCKKNIIMMAIKR